MRTDRNKKNTSKYDEVNHPLHYNRHPSGVECITIIEWFTLNVGNAIKYLWRAGLKDNQARDNQATTYDDVLAITIKDLKKTEWYIRREIERLEKKIVNK